MMPTRREKRLRARACIRAIDRLLKEAPTRAHILWAVDNFRAAISPNEQSPGIIFNAAHKRTISRVCGLLAPTEGVKVPMAIDEPRRAALQEVRAIFRAEASYGH